MVTSGQALGTSEPGLFENTGTGPRTLFGRVTGARYFFPGPGARVLIDARDASSIEAVQGVAMVKGLEADPGSGTR